MDYEHLFLEQLAVIEQAVRFIARRHRLSPDETDDLSSSVKLKIVENDYEVLRKFQNRSTLRTYLTAVIQRHFLDMRVAAWGKWRPSAQARRLGPTAVLLDRLMTREGLPFDEAADTLQANYKVTESREALRALSVQLPQRTPRRFVGDDHLADFPAPADGEEAVIREIDEAGEADRVERALASSLAKLRSEDRLVLKMRFVDALQVSTIARVLQIDQKQLYRRLDAVLRTLRGELEVQGIPRERALAVVALSSAGLRPVLGGTAAENTPAGPSTS